MGRGCTTWELCIVCLSSSGSCSFAWAPMSKPRCRGQSNTTHHTPHTSHHYHYTLHTTHYTPLPLHTTHYTTHTTHYTPHTTHCLSAPEIPSTTSTYTSLGAHPHTGPPTSRLSGWVLLCRETGRTFGTSPYTAPPPSPFFFLYKKKIKKDLKKQGGLFKNKISNILNI